jgi:transposase
MDVTELVRRWQAGESQRRIARDVGLARATVQKYLQVAERLGLSSNGPAPDADQVAQLVRLGELAVERPAPLLKRLEHQREQVGRWLGHDRLQLTRVQELLAQQGIVVTYSTLRRFVRRAGLLPSARTTVRMADTAPGEVAEMDFGRLGVLVDQDTGKRVTIWALVVVLSHSRHSFVWPLLRQTLPAVIEGLEMTWRFFGGIPQRLVIDYVPRHIIDVLLPVPLCGRVAAPTAESA